MFGKMKNALKEKRQVELENLEDEILKKKRSIKELDMEIKNKELDIKQKEDVFNFSMKETRQNFELEKKKADSEIEIELDATKKTLELDRQRFDSEKEEIEKKWQNKYDNDIATLALKNEQDLAKVKNDNEKEMIALQEKSAEEVNKKVKEMQDSNYATLQKALTKLHDEGNATTKFMQEITKDLIGNAGNLLAGPETKVSLKVNQNDTVDTTSSTINS
jgi:hypothetical protein